MSYSFDGTGDNLRGQFGTTYNSVPITLACFIKISAHPAAADMFVNFGETNASIDHTHFIRTAIVDDSWEAVSDAGASAGTATVASVNIDSAAIGTTYNATTGWAGIVGVFTNDSLRDLYIAALANTGQNTATRVVNNGLSYIAVAEALTAAQVFTGLMAEVAIWNAALTTNEVTSYLAGNSASQIQAANLIGYWPLSASNATQSNEGVDAGGDLAVTNAVFSSDHPTITLAGSAARSSKKRLMMGVA
jgi:hypothetical protein